MRPALTPRLLLLLGALAFGWSMGHIVSSRLQSRKMLDQMADLVRDELNTLLDAGSYARVEPLLRRVQNLDKIVAVHWISPYGEIRNSYGKPTDGLALPRSEGVYLGTHLVAWKRLPSKDWLRLELQILSPSPWFCLLGALTMVLGWVLCGRKISADKLSREAKECSEPSSCSVSS